MVGFDVERHHYGEEKYPAQLVLQDILTLDGRQFRGRVSLIVASPPCQEFSYMAMPWRRAKQIAAAFRGEAEFPAGYTGSRTVAELTALFDACLRIGREAECPVVIENVRGAQPWIGRARHNYGSYFLWGDVPALMPVVLGLRKSNPDRKDAIRGADGSWFKTEAERATKNTGGSWFNVGSPGQPGLSGPRTNGKGDGWFEGGAARHGSKSSARKAASAAIAKIPLPLARFIATVYYPRSGVVHESNNSEAGRPVRALDGQA